MIKEVPSYTGPRRLQKPRRASSGPKVSLSTSDSVQEVVAVSSRKKRKTSEYVKKKRKVLQDLCREWLVPIKYRDLRYVGLRGIYWYWLSRDVRKSEWEKWGGLCLTCLKPIEHWTKGHCGHVVAAQHCGEYLRFNRINLTIQHAACNSDRITPDAAALNAIHYNQRHGDGAWERLRALKKVECKEPRQEEYRELIRALPSYQEAVQNSQQATEPVLSSE